MQPKQREILWTLLGLAGLMTVTELAIDAYRGRRIEVFTRPWYLGGDLLLVGVWTGLISAALSGQPAIGLGIALVCLVAFVTWAVCWGFWQ